MALEETLLGLAIGLVVAALVFVVMKARLRHRIEMVESEFRRTWAEQESATRRDAAQRSRYVLKGKIAEHIVPLLRDVFRFNPADARFIGAPIDYLIFDGYTDVKDGESDSLITVVLADVKTGEARLSRTERKIKEAVEAGRVRWETIRVDF
ncbi:MAG: Holliday junction resolvase-like protein [Candidatus Thorarchaeota archaeon]|jgi:predicted Holliday junction resolvase-like endonuclease